MSRIKNIKNKVSVLNLSLSAMFVAVGIVLPFFTGQIPQIGNMLLPMHIPVFLCALICPWQYSLAVGIILPLLRSFIFTMPTLYPTAISMSVELATYAIVTGLIYRLFKRKNIGAVYGSMLPAMVLGRVTWGIAQVVLLGIGQSGFTFQAFVAGAFINAVPGIILQLILIPLVISALNYSGVLKDGR